MNRAIKDATVKRYHYASHDELRQHLQLFIDGYNYGRRLKTLRGLTPYEFIVQAWTKQPQRFRPDPSHHMLGSTSSAAKRAGMSGMAVSLGGNVASLTHLRASSTRSRPTAELAKVELRTCTGNMRREGPGRFQSWFRA